MQATLSARQTVNAGAWRFSTGLAWATGPHRIALSTRAEVFAAEVAIHRRAVDREALSLSSAWLLRRRGDVPASWDATGGAALAWSPAARWAIAVRYEYGSAARSHGAIAADPLDPDWIRARHRFGLAARWRVHAGVWLRAQVQLDDPRWLPDPIVAGFAVLDVGAGPHAALDR